MKILLIHYRYYIEGGPERYLFNIKEVLEQHGHTVIPFSLKYPQSIENEYDKYFSEPVVKEFHLSKAKIKLTDKIKSAKNYIYNKDAKKNLKKLIADLKPDIAYVLIYSGKLTYSVIEACKEMNIPVVHRISEFYHYCVKSSFFRDGKVCTECLKNPKACIEHRCVHGSKIKSALNYYAEQKEKKSGIRDYFSFIICPSSFTQNVYKENCIYPKAEILHVPTLFNFKETEIPSEDLILKRKKEMNICYIGRVCQEKGIDAIIETWKLLEQEGVNCKLHLTGCFDDVYGVGVKNKIKAYNLNNIIIYGFLPKNETFKIINNSFVSLIPSIWYDNMPNSFIESQAYGVPVIASDIGSLTELIQEGVNGYLFEPDNAVQLANKIKEIISMSNSEYIKMSNSAITFIQNYCSKDNHYNKLMQIFNDTIIKGKNN